MNKKEKSKEKNDLPDDNKPKDSPELQEEKETTLAKRSGQRPALPFRRKPPA